MTTFTHLSPRQPKALGHARKLLTPLRRTSYRLRRQVRSWRQDLAERMRYMNIDSDELGRLVAVVTVSRALFLLLLAALFIVFYMPFARAALQAMGFPV